MTYFPKCAICTHSVNSHYGMNLVGYTEKSACKTCDCNDFQYHEEEYF